MSGTFQALTSRDYRLFAGGQAISVSGVWMQKLAQAWLVLVVTNSSFMVGVTVALQQLPTLFLTAAGGAMADRFERRTLLIITNLLGMIPALALGTVAGLHVAQPWMVMAAAFVQGLIDALEKPTRMTLANDLVGPEMLTNAVVLNNIIQNVGKLVGPAAAGIVIATAGVPAAFFINAASFVPVVIGLMFIRPAYATDRVGQSDFGLRDTLRYVASRREIVVALALTAVVGLFGYNFQVLIPVLFRNVFHGGATAAGLGLTAMGLGAVVGGVALAGRIRATSLGLLASSGAFGIGLVLLAAAPDRWAGYAACFVAGAISVAFAATSGARLQLASDPAMRGRIMGLYVTALAGTSPAGGPLTGAISQLTSARVAFAVCAAAIGVAVLVAYRFSVRDGGPVEVPGESVAVDASPGISASGARAPAARAERRAVPPGGARRDVLSLRRGTRWHGAANPRGARGRVR